jgi:hypothetical protein
LATADGVALSAIFQCVEIHNIVRLTAGTPRPLFPTIICSLGTITIADFASHQRFVLGYGHPVAGRAGPTALGVTSQAFQIGTNLRRRLVAHVAVFLQCPEDDLFQPRRTRRRCADT